MADRQRNIALIVVNIYIGAIQTNAGKSKGKRDWKCSKVNQYMSHRNSGSNFVTETHSTEDHKTGNWFQR